MEVHGLSLDEGSIEVADKNNEGKMEIKIGKD